MGQAFHNWLWPLLTHRLVLLSVGGAVGTNARYFVGLWFRIQPWSDSFPFLGTFVINVTGSFILGAAIFLFEERIPPEQRHWLLLIGTGFCGGYTTFSTFEWETFDLALRQGSWWLALGYVLGSVVAGFFAIVVAVRLMGRIFTNP